MTPSTVHKNHKSFLRFESNQQAFFYLLAVFRLNRWVGHFSWIISHKETQFMCVVNCVNYNICMSSSNDNVRWNGPQRAFWARVLKATCWRIHEGEQGREEASLQRRATTARAPQSQDFFSDWDSVTSRGWHILMADAHRKAMLVFKGVTARFYHRQFHGDWNISTSKYLL